MPSLLVCTDGSIYAPSIYRHAAWAALRLGAQVQVLHVIEHHRELSPIHDLSGAIGIDASAELTAELAKLEETQGRVARLKGKVILEEAQRQFTDAGVSAVNTLQRHGTFVETLEELEPGAELVVVGKRGEHADFVKGHLGSNFEDLIRISVRPVLVAARAFQPIHRFLIAFDDSPSARKAVAYVASSPLLRGLDCHLMMVGRADPAHSSALDRAREQLTQAGYSVTAHIKPGSAGTAIAEEVKQASVDLLVMGAYGHSVIREFIVGSTTTKMVRTCAVPVLMFR
jgi:nucleotide-binding universal stress UspA family protein